MYKLGSLFAVEPNTSNVSLKPRPHVLLVEPVITSKSLPSGLKRKAAWRERELLAVDLAVEARVADDAPDVVVHPVLEIGQGRMRVALSPARAQDLALVGLVVAVGVLEKEDVRRLRDDDAAVGEHQARRDVELVGEHRELVGLAVAIGVLEDADAVAAGLARRRLVRVVHRLERSTSGRARRRRTRSA